MVRILGSSTERVPIKDLNDVVFFKQVKEYTDQEFESSKDLKRAISQGRLAKIDHVPCIRGTIDGGNDSGSPVTIQQNGVSRNDIKDAVREVLSEGKLYGGSGQDMSGAHDIKSAMMDILPHLMDAVRQEVSSKLSGIQGLGTGSGQKSRSTSTYVDPTYIPNIDTSGMVSNIKVEEKKVSGADMELALAALQQINKSK